MPPLLAGGCVTFETAGNSAPPTCRCSAPSAVLPEDLALNYRQRLFGDGLRMYMQPQIDLRTGALAKVEALARLELADGRVVPPGEFLPLLGRADLGRLFRMGLDIALSSVVDWDRQGLAVDVSLNLAPSTLSDRSCARWVEEALQRHGVAPSRLTLEVLETESMEHRIRDTAIEELIRIGVHLAMDDLGSGYSSLQRLSALPFETIKSDQGLLRRIGDDPVRTLSLIGAIVQMGRDFERTVVVEGLEDVGLVEAAAILGAPQGQGYGLARPMPAEAVLRWSQAFDLPIRIGEIHTFLGALAYHWRLMHGEGGSATGGACPLAAFLQGLGAEGRDALGWYGQFRSGPDGKRAGKKLTDWLVGRFNLETSAETAPPMRMPSSGS